MLSAIIEINFISIWLAVLTLEASMCNWTAMFKQGRKKWADNYRSASLNKITEKALKLVLEENLIIHQKANLKIWQGIIKINFIQSNSTWLFRTSLLKLGNYSLPKMTSFEVTSFKVLIDGRCVRKSNIIISKLSNKRERGKIFAYSRLTGWKESSSS